MWRWRLDFFSEGGLSFLCFAPSLAVFVKAYEFNQDVSNWNTGAVTTMAMSKCTLSPSVVLWCKCIMRQLDFHRDHNSHTFCFFCVFKTVLFFVVCGGSFLFFVAPFLAVFYVAKKFNQNVSKWNTGAVTNMNSSKCTLSLSVVTPSVVVYFEYTTTRVLSDHTSHTFCFFLCF